MSAAVRDNVALSRFELDGAGVTAFMQYSLGDGVIALEHTETPPQARGHGLGSALIAGVLATVRARRLKIVPRCPFVRAFLEQHPQYADLVA